MANFFQKSCCNFSRFWIASTNLFTSKTSLKYPLSTSFMLNSFGCKRYIHLHRPFYNLLTPGVGHSRPCVKWVHTTRTGFSIEEFFPPGVLETQQPLPEEVKSGRSWRAAELRQKSNEDLHKLWYVLLKERNMLLTVQAEARRQEVVMPSPQRFHKVKKSMAMIKVVLDERKRAIEAIERNYKNAEKNTVELTANSLGGKDKVDKNSKIDQHQLSITT
ncbi:39S ribosomal L47, mitochondrial [Paramuricea clavata]|uniref:Large ribosomal subunit protein uL29m n=1 Tax=Paramuricea clavata TaxID=317549 RepID=A0A6S7GRS5_PARCT|nr:39S ribosomal L47, mitochondrial [Paramuricea clavata]